MDCCCLLLLLLDFLQYYKKKISREISVLSVYKHKLPFIFQNNACLGKEWKKAHFNQCTLSHFKDYGNTPLHLTFFNTCT